MGQNKDHEQLEAIDEIAGRGLVTDVIGVVKSGKEATVYCCRTPSGGLAAAKVYRSRDVRSFRDDSSYRAGRLPRRNRYARAIEQKSRAGRAFAFDAWVAAEYDSLSRLHAAGCDVPEPIAQTGRVILMEYVGDEDGPAPQLTSVRLAPEDAQPAFDRLLANVERMLACDRIHGDLSAYNVLWWRDAPCLIDFPQAVDPRTNANALALLERDIANLAGHFARFGVQCDAWRHARALWAGFLRGDLAPAAAGEGRDARTWRQSRR